MKKHFQLQFWIWNQNIYIYAFSRRFYPKRLIVHSGYTFLFYQYVCSLGIEPTANEMLYHWATGANNG